MLETPGFHHLHLNSVDPEAAIAFYSTLFAATTGTTWGGLPAVHTPNNVLILFNRVASPPATSPQTAFWHFGWNVPDSRQRLTSFENRQDVRLVPLYTGDDDGGTVFISSDTWPGTGGVLGRTRLQIAEAKAENIQPRGHGGFAYLEGPDDALVEYAGNYPDERFNHVHMFQEDPFCAQLWYQTHLNAPRGNSGSAPRTDATCKVERGPDLTFPALEPRGAFRTPSAAVEFGDVALPWYMRQGEQPLVSTRGHLYDHIALSVTDLDAWATKLRDEGVSFLEERYKLGDTRALMIEGPSLEAIELVEVT